MNRDTIQKILIGLFAAACIFLGIQIVDVDNVLEFDNNSPKTEMAVASSGSRMTYGRFLEYLELGWVKQVDLYDNNRNAIVLASSPELGNRPQAIRVEIPVGASQLIQKLKEYNIDFDAHPLPQKSLLITIASNLILPLIFIAGLIFFFQNSENMGQNNSMSPMNLGKSTARFDQRPETGICFDDIAGIDEAKAEFEEIVSFLREPERYTLVGAKIPKGVLLVGPPGTGKTLLAKAIASEANVPFYNVAGSEFVEMFIGIGAARIRDLFKKASENTPCIVFIDEIDAVGRERGAGIGGGNDEREQTLNQLLTEMDGFKENKGVIVVGATNRVDILDAALLRPGRFDRQVTVNPPDRLGRLAILNVHARNKRLADGVKLESIAQRTPGFAGADLANLLNEAAILTARREKTSITNDEINSAIDRIIAGLEGAPLLDSKSKRLIAYQEVGRAIVGTLVTSHDPVQKVTLIPRGNSRGLTWFTPGEDQGLISRSQLLAQIIGTLGGRAAEQIVFGTAEVTTAASGDLQRVTSIARQMVTRYGMSNIGPIALETQTNGQVFLGSGMASSSEYADDVANRIDEQVCQIIHDCEQKALQIMEENRAALDLLVDILIDKETIDGPEFTKILEKYTVVPNKSELYVSQIS